MSFGYVHCGRCRVLTDNGRFCMSCESERQLKMSKAKKRPATKFKINTLCVACDNQVTQHGDSLCGACIAKRIQARADERAASRPAIKIPDDVVTNSAGAKQSRTEYRCDLLPVKATLAVAEVLKNGAAKYGDNNWRGITTPDHLNHALIHIFAHLAGDTQEPHLSHAACRVLMALETQLCSPASS